MNKYNSNWYTVKNQRSTSGVECYESIKVDNLSNLWRAVVLQAVQDIHLKPRTKKTRSARNKALVWVNIANEDFKEVCYLAGFDPLYIIEMKNSGKKMAMKGVKFMI